jgi:paired amphipathic helix protein Sin3a
MTFRFSSKLTFSFLDQTTRQIGYLERKKTESMLHGVVPTFFVVDQNVFNQAFVVVVAPSAKNAGSNISDEVSSVIDDTEISSVASSISQAGKSREGGVGSSGGDLPKKRRSTLRLPRTHHLPTTCRTRVPI